MSLPQEAKKLLIQKFSKIGLIVISGALLVTFFRTHVQPWYMKRRGEQAEKHANIIYELRKTRSAQQEQNES